MNGYLTLRRPLTVLLVVGLLAFVSQAAFGALIAEYTFDAGTAQDDSGNGNDATVYGATLTADRFGNTDSAYAFDGNDYIQTPLDSNFKPLAFSVWFNAASIGGEQSIVDSDAAGHYGHSLIIDYALAGPSTGNLDVQYHNGASDTGDDGKVTVGQWHHAVVNFGTSIEVYLDNSLVYNASYTSTSFDGSQFRLGRHNSSDPQWFHGEIDDVRFYDATLSSDEVSALYHAPSPVPEPASWLLFGVLILGGCLFRRSRP